MAAILEAHDGAWIAVQVRPRFERAVSGSLQRRGYVEFLPTYTPLFERTPARADGRVLFPGYVFCRYVRFPAFRIVEIPGVVRLVGFGNKVALIPDQEIEDIRKIVASGADSRVVPFIREGERIEVVNGPLKGVTGVLSRLKSRDCVVISVPLLSRSVAAEVNLRDVRPIARDPVEHALSQRRPAAHAAESCDRGSAIVYPREVLRDARRGGRSCPRRRCCVAAGVRRAVGLSVPPAASPLGDDARREVPKRCLN